jgi:hypothetical protein
MSSRDARLIHLTLQGLAGPLESLLQERAGLAPPIAGLVCHPHPLYGGTLHNKVVHRTATVLHGLGAAVLRFNFRGVGKSAGRYDHGAGELDDARVALEFLRGHQSRARLWVAGFSFGAWIAARLAASESDVSQLILVAPPVGTSSFEVLRGARVPKLVLQGTADTVCPPAALAAEFPNWAEPKKLVEIDGATHFFDKQLGALADAMSQALAPAAARGTSEVT